MGGLEGIAEVGLRIANCELENPLSGYGGGQR